MAYLKIKKAHLGQMAFSTLSTIPKMFDKMNIFAIVGYSNFFPKCIFPLHANARTISIWRNQNEDEIDGVSAKEKIPRKLAAKHKREMNDIYQVLSSYVTQTFIEILGVKI